VSAWLHSPVTLVISGMILVAWVLTLCALFWPRKNEKDDENDNHICF
jgi:hypothetical protein